MEKLTQLRTSRHRPALELFPATRSRVGVNAVAPDDAEAQLRDASPRDRPQRTVSAPQPSRAPEVGGRVDVAGLAEVVARDEPRRDDTQASSGIGRPVRRGRRASGCPRVAAVRRGDDVPAVRAQLPITRATAAGARSRPVREHDERSLDVVASAARPQRSEAPGPRAQSAQRTRRASPRSTLLRSAYAPSTTTTSSTGLAATRPSTSGSSSALLRAAEAGRAPAARTTAATRLICSTTRHRVDDDGLGGCSVAGSPSCPIRSTTSRPLGHRADDRVVGREPDVVAGDDEELAAGRARRLGRGLRHRDHALRVRGVRRPARRRSSSPGPPLPDWVGSPPWITKPGTIRWKTVSSKKPCTRERDERRRGLRAPTSMSSVTTNVPHDVSNVSVHVFAGSSCAVGCVGAAVLARRGSLDVLAAAGVVVGRRVSSRRPTTGRLVAPTARREERRKTAALRTARRRIARG